jgi:DNA polymerase III alpha subunit
MTFAELGITSNFTFLTGGAHPEEYAWEAAYQGIAAIAIADENSVAGIVRAHVALRDVARRAEERRAALAETGRIGPPAPPDAPRPPSADLACLPRLIPGAKLVLRDGLTVTALPQDRAAWGRLCRLLTLGRRRAKKGDCDLNTADLLAFGAGQMLLLHPPAGPAPGWLPRARRLIARFGDDMALAMAPRHDGRDPARFARLANLARSLGLPTIASAAPIMHRARRRRLVDVLTCIRTGTTIDALGRAAQANAEQRLRPEAEMRRIFAGHGDAVDRAAAIAARCRFSLDELAYEYPSELTADETPIARLSRLATAGLAGRYPAGPPARVRAMMDHELGLIAKLRYEPYFLTVHDVVAFARSRGILCQGRGSAANSVVCYALGITSVSPEIGTMVFERFVSEARNEPPDIDVDFEHERREEVIQHIYERYGRHRAGLCATVIHYRGKRAVREVGRAMGLSEDITAALSSQLWGWGSGGVTVERLREIGLDPADRRLVQTLQLCAEIRGFPRHLSQHVGGFVITEGRLDELVPVENATMEDRTVICLGQGRYRRAGHPQGRCAGAGHADLHPQGVRPDRRSPWATLDAGHLPPRTGPSMTCCSKADSLGVFQVESRAQMNFLPRMRPRCFYDLVIQVAIIRPGPIQGDMVHPFIRRRNGEEPVTFPSDALGQVLGKTLGVPLFQEQAMQIAIVGAGFSGEEADRLRRALATFKKHGSVHAFRQRFLAGMRANGYDAAFAERCFSQIEGFGSYGFPESHAASFALLVYASAWLKRHHPGIFACALLNSQPMGFYAPAQIVRDARAHGVTVRPVCINESYWDHSMEPDGRGGLALRLGFRQIKSLAEADGQWIAAARGNGYRSVEDVWRRAGLPPRQIAALAEADAFAGLGMTRRDALWAARAIGGADPLPLFSGDLDGEGIVEPAVTLPPASLGEELAEDYAALRLSLRAHPVALLREVLTPGWRVEAALAPALPAEIAAPARSHGAGAGARR